MTRSELQAKVADLLEQQLSMAAGVSGLIPASAAEAISHLAGAYAELAEPVEDEVEDE